MSFSTENIATAKDIICERRLKAEAEATARLKQVYRECPELRDIDSGFSRIGQELLLTFTDLKDKEKTQARLDALKAESEMLEQARAELLSALGHPADYTKPHYFCEKCGDTGYTEFKMCDCIRKELVMLGYKSSGLGSLLGKQRFENYSLDYYQGDDRLTMEQNLAICISYAETFGKNSESMLFMGNTGLGKTHLSTSIAASVIERGFDVVYETAQNLIATFSNERFHSYGNVDRSGGSSRYFDCDLLIIDDFGTEESNQFSVACFYNLINTRTNNSRPIIINTNLTRGDIRTRYTDRIASRLFGEFTVLSFPGKDIRMQKLYE